MTAVQKNKKPSSSATPKAVKKSTKKSQKPSLTPCDWFKIAALPAWVGTVLVASEYIITFSLYSLIGLATLKTPVWTAVTGALVYITALLVIIFLPPKLLHRAKTSREELGLKGLPIWADLALAPLGFIAYFILALIFLQFFSLFPFFDASETQETGFSVLSSGLDRVVAFFTLVVIPAIAEELIFRGWLYGKLRAKIPGRRASLFVSIFITSLMFALVHRQWNVGVNVFAMSLVLCALREVTGTIYSGIFLHMLKNGVAFFLLYIANLSV